jgi:hypothetical protein
MGFTPYADAGFLCRRTLFLLPSSAASTPFIGLERNNFSDKEANFFDTHCPLTNNSVPGTGIFVLESSSDVLEVRSVDCPVTEQK